MYWSFTLPQEEARVPSRQPVQISVTWDQVAAFRLSRHHLSGRAAPKALRSIVRDFDSFLLGQKERDHLVAMKHRPSVYRPQGWIAPDVLVDGRIIAVWEHARERDRIRVSVTKFGSISRRIAASIREEARDLGRFLSSPNVDIQIL